MFLQLGVVLFLIRFLQPGIPLPDMEARVSTSYVSVSFSEFLSIINNSEIHKAEVEGVHFSFCLKLEDVNPPENTVVLNRTAKRLLYTTTLPSNMRMPYEEMLEKQLRGITPREILVPYGEQHPQRRLKASFKSFMIAMLAIVITTFSTRIDSKSFQNDEVEAGDDVPYSYGIFHFIFSMGAMYFGMLLLVGICTKRCKGGA